MSSVQSLNTLSTDLTLTGTQNVSVSDDGNTIITITGPDLSSFTTTAELNAVSGTLSSEIDSDITEHAADSSAHHARYTDSEAVSATDAARTSLSGSLSTEIDADMSTHTADVNAHHTRYTDADAVSGTQSVRDTLQTSLCNKIVSVSGSLQTQIDNIDVVDSLNSLTGDLTLIGAGTISVSSVGSTVTVSGAAGSSGVWEDLVSFNLSSPSSTVTVSNIPARDYYQVLFDAETSAANYRIEMTFNNDTADSYLWTNHNIGSSGMRSGFTGDCRLTGDINFGGAASEDFPILRMDITNLSSRCKTYTGNGTTSHEPEFDQTPTTGVFGGMWKNTSNQINRIDFTMVGVNNPGGTRVEFDACRVQILGMNV